MAETHIDITADDKDFYDSIKNSEAALDHFIDQISKGSKKIDVAFTDAAETSKMFQEAIQIQKKAVSELDNEYERASKSLTALANSYSGDHKFSDKEIEENTKKYAAQKKQVDELKIARDAESKSLSKLETAYTTFTKEQEKLSKSERTYLTQIRQTREEMARIRGESGIVSPENMQRYDQLKAKLTELGTSLNIVKREQKDLTTQGNAQLSGIIQGITGLAGAFSAGQGVVSLFAKDNEQLAAIQTKLQAAMAITIGLQQVSNTLHATSSFRINTVTKATQLWNNAVKALNINLGISQTLSKGLVGIGIGALIAAIVILVSKYKEWNKQQEETKRLNKIVTDSLKESALEGQKAAQKETVALNILYKASQNENKSKSERLKAVSELQKQYPGYFGNLSKEEILAGKGADAYNRLASAIIASAKARAAQDRIVENQSKILDLEAKRADALAKKEKAESERELASFRNNPANSGGNPLAANAMMRNTGKEISESTSDIEDYSKEIWNATKEIGKLNEANQELAETISVSDLVSDSNTSTATKAVKETKDQTQKLLDELLKLREKNQQDEINLMEEGLEKRLAQIDFNYNKEIDEIRKKEKEFSEASEGITIDQSLEITTAYSNAYKKQAQEREKANSDVLKESETLLKELLSKYQDYNAQRLEINKKFKDDLVALESQAASEQRDNAIAELKKQWKEALSSINLSEFQENIDWSVLFGNLDKVSTNELISLRDKLKSYINEVGSSLSPQDLKTVTDAFENLNEKIADKKPITELKDGYNEYRAALEEVIKQKKELAKYEKGTEEYAKTVEAIKNAENARVKSLTKMSQSINKIGSVGSELVNSGQELVDTLTNIGIKIPEAVQGALSGIGQIMGGLEKLNLTNPTSIITSAVSVVSGIGNALASVFGGGKTVVSQSTYDSYNKLMTLMDKVIAKQKELLESLSGKEAVEASKEAAAAIERQIEATKNLGKEYNASGGSTFTNSYGVRQYNDLKKYRSQLKALGIDFDSLGGRLEGLYDLSAEQLQLIQEQLPDAWNALWDETQGYLQTIIDSEKELQKLKDSLNEALTGLSFDSLKNSLDSLLQSADTTFEDIGNSFEDHMRDAVLNFVKNKYLTDALQDWYDKFAEAYSDDVLSETEVEELRRMYEEAYNRAQQMYDSALSAAGVSKDSSDVEASSKGIASISQDSANELNGNFFALLQKTGDIRNINEASRLLLMGVNSGIGDIQAIMRENSKVFQDSLNVQIKIEQNTFRSAELLNKFDTTGIAIRN